MLTLHTDKAKAHLNLTNSQLVSAVNGALNNATIEDQAYIADIHTIYEFIVDRKFAKPIETCKNHFGGFKLEFIPVAPVFTRVIDFGEPIQSLDVCDDFETYLSLKYVQLKLSAKKRNIEFGLSLSELRRLLKRKTCQYTGIKFDDQAHSLSIDRIDASKGYVMDNIVVCSRVVNEFKANMIEDRKVKGNLTQKEMCKMFTSFAKLVDKGLVI